MEVSEEIYLLCVKDNHPNLKKDIEDFVQDQSPQTMMQSVSKNEKNHGRIETRTAFVTSEIQWLEQRKGWKGMTCIGAICTESTTKKKPWLNGITIFAVGI